MLCLDLDALDTIKLGKRCYGNGGVCSRTGKPHIVLQGSAKGGARWTAVAAAYPPQLCDAMVRALLAKTRADLASSSVPTLPAQRTGGLG